MGGSQTTNEIGGLENFPKINNREGGGQIIRYNRVDINFILLSCKNKNTPSEV